MIDALLMVLVVGVTVIALGFDVAVAVGWLRRQNGGRRQMLNMLNKPPRRDGAPSRIQQTTLPNARPERKSESPALSDRERNRSATPARSPRVMDNRRGRVGVPIPQPLRQRVTDN